MPVAPLQTLLGFKAIGLASGLKESDRRVACALLDHFNRKTGQCDPSLPTLAGLLGLSDRTVIRATIRLEAAGLFRKIRHGGNFHRNLYVPVWLKFGQIGADWDERRRAHSARTFANESSPLQCQPSQSEGDKVVTQTCTTNLSKVTSRGRSSDDNLPAPSKRSFSKRLADGSKRAGGQLTHFVPRQASSRDAARQAAQRRWDNDLLNQFVSQQGVYASILEQVEESMIAAATDAELVERGGGLRYLIKALKLGSRQ